jgi:hypothetical protein
MDTIQYKPSDWKHPGSPGAYRATIPMYLVVIVESIVLPAAPGHYIIIYDAVPKRLLLVFLHYQTSS